MKNAITIILALIFLMMLASCGGNANTEHQDGIREPDLVPTGTYTGNNEQVDAEEREVYVYTVDGKMLELYFNDQTQVTRRGERVTFDALRQGQRVEVMVQNTGDKLEPININILE